MPRLPPWRYPRDDIPSRWTLRSWRRRANKLAKERGARQACGICKRPMDQWGNLYLRHPRSYGNSRKRDICISCANLLIHVFDVLEWFGARDHLPTEIWEDNPNATDYPPPDPDEREGPPPTWHGPEEQDPYADERED